MLKSVLRVTVLAASLTSGAVAAEILYGVTLINNQLLTLDTATGAATLVGPLSSSMSALGLATSGGRLYTFDQVADVIREIDPATGSTVTTHDVGLGNLIGEGGLAMMGNGTGFLVTGNGVTGNLYSFNVNTNTSSLIGPTLSFDGLEFIGGVLYGINQVNGALYTVNQGTGQTTLVGPGITPAGSLSGLAARSDGTLFGLQNGTTLYSIDAATGIATSIGATGFNDIAGLTFFDDQEPIPEPSTIALLGAGLAAMALVHRRRRAG